MGFASLPDPVHAPAARISISEALITPQASRNGMPARDEADLAGTTATLVIDDLDRLDQDERACAALEALVLDRPPALRLLLLSRHKPPLPVGRLRARSATGSRRTPTPWSR